MAVSPRVEKSVRLTAASVVTAGVGIAAVVTDSEILGFVAVAIIVAAVLAGPLVTRLLGVER